MYYVWIVWAFLALFVCGALRAIDYFLLADRSWDQGRTPPAPVVTCKMGIRDYMAVVVLSFFAALFIFALGAHPPDRQGDGEVWESLIEPSNPTPRGVVLEERKILRLKDQEHLRKELDEKTKAGAERSLKSFEKLMEQERSQRDKDH